MNHAQHAVQPSVTRQALDATRHCLTGCAIGEVSLTLAADTVSIVVMELVDNLIVGLVIAFAAAFPVNRRLISRGRGHALAHGTHG